MALSRDQRTGAEMAAGGAATLAAPVALNAGHGRLVRHQMDRKAGTLGGLDQDGKPVNPFTLDTKRGDKGGASPAAHATHRFDTARAPYLERLKKPPLRGIKGAVAGTAAGAVGTGLLLEGAKRVSSGSGHGRKITEDVAKSDYDFSLSPQYSIGIPPNRGMPVSPLAMWASGNIMLGVKQKADGKQVLNPFTRKKQRRQVNQFAGALGMLYSPLGIGQRMTG
jgi:hypothetical protein